MKGWPIPGGVRACLDTLRRTGHAAYPVGGCVRDLLLGRTPGDFDVCTDARPERVMELFPHTVPTGLRHGTVTVRTEDVLPPVADGHGDAQGAQVLHRGAVAHVRAGDHHARLVKHLGQGGHGHPADAH